MASVHSFNLGYTAPAMDIGSGYARGIESAGKSISHAIDSVSDIYRQNIDANDTLKSLHEAGILKKEEFESVMGKSLGAKQAMVGQFIANWAGKVKTEQETAKDLAVTGAQSAGAMSRQVVAGEYGLRESEIRKGPAAGDQPMVFNRPSVNAPVPASPDAIHKELERRYEEERKRAPNLPPLSLSVPRPQSRLSLNEPIHLFGQ